MARSAANIKFYDCTVKVKALPGGTSTDVGWLSESGVSISLETTPYEVKSAYSRYPVVTIMQDKKVNVKCGVLETTLANLAIQWGTTDSTTPINIGATDDIVYYEVIVEAAISGGSTKRTFTCPYCTMTSSGDTMYALTKETIFELNFNALPDPTTGYVCVITEA